MSDTKTTTDNHYVDNEKFSAAVEDYVTQANEAEAAGLPTPQVGTYVADCFMRIAEGLSHKSSYVRYTYRDEMVLDAVENCLRAVRNYKVDTETRTGKPNAFAYFTQISLYAFWRRIKKEKRQQEIKMRYLSHAGHEQYINDHEAGDESAIATAAFVDNLMLRMGEENASPPPGKRGRKKKVPTVDSDLSAHSVD